jgi:CRP/FNR family transcriptional regulator, cyclic AMP receptor protein
VDDLLPLTEGRPEVSVAAGEVLIAEGASTGRLFVLLEGRLAVRKGDETVATLTEPGACVGEMAALLGIPHTAAVVAEQPCRLRIVDDAGLVLRDDPQLLGAVARLLARRLQLVTSYLGDLRNQYAHLGGGLGMVHEVLGGLAQHYGEPARPGSARDPDPHY